MNGHNKIKNVICRKCGDSNFTIECEEVNCMSPVVVTRICRSCGAEWSEKPTKRKRKE